MQIYTSKETIDKVEEIKEKRPYFNFSNEFKNLIDRMHGELYSDNLELLKKRDSELIKQQKEIEKEMITTKERIKKAELEEPERKKIEEKKKQREIREYNVRFTNGVNSILRSFEITKEEAEELVKEYLSSSEFKNKGRGITEFVIREGYKLNSETLRAAKEDKETNFFYSELGYKFDF